jgi:uncharacterized protein YkwD
MTERADAPRLSVEDDGQRHAPHQLSRSWRQWWWLVALGATCFILTIIALQLSSGGSWLNLPRLQAALLAHVGIDTQVDERFTQDEFAAAVAQLTNRRRVDAGVPPLRRNPQLDQSAGEKLDHMVAHRYFTHGAPDGTDWVSFIRTVGYPYDDAGENLAADYATPDGVMDGWINSPAHRENLLSPKYDEFGLAVRSFNRNPATGKPGWMVVAHYGRQQGHRQQ